LNEIARTAKVGIHLEEDAIPIKPDVRAACELLGLDPLYVANEGKLVCFCEPRDADAVLAAMQAHPLGRDAAMIGTVTEDDAHLVEMETEIGGVRVVDWLAGEQLPRIC
jgi:hydrogenase expression/formation protein HypE